MGFRLLGLAGQRMALGSHPRQGLSIAPSFNPTLVNESLTPRAPQFWHITGTIVLGLIGFIISMSTLNAAARYVALFLQASSYAGYVGTR
jgi:hypothetical protein